MTGPSPPPSRKMPGGRLGLVLTAVVVLLLSDLLLSFFGNGGSTTISHTEFNNQLNSGNITKIYSKGAYTDFTSQRPAFANDNLWTTLQQQNVTVTACPVVQQRRFLANLLISLAPMLLLILVWVLLARGMAGRWGMSERVGRLTAVPQDAQGAYGLSAAPTTQDAVDQEARRIVAECYDDAIRLLKENRDRLDALAKAILEAETLDEDAAYAAAGPRR